MDFTIRDRGHLPHWESPTGRYFITFRLADSLPQSALRFYEERRRILLRKLQGQADDTSQQLRHELDTLFSETIEKYLDQAVGARHLARPEIAEIVAGALTHFDGQRYRLLAWCVMPNHVHVVCKPMPGGKLERLVHSWKSFTAKQANSILGLTGAFWQREYYDHLIRDEQDEARVVSYTVRNPEMAGLKNWKWVWPQR